jgi:hypothetical protein
MRSTPNALIFSRLTVLFAIVPFLYTAIRSASFIYSSGNLKKPHLDEGDAIHVQLDTAANLGAELHPVSREVWRGERAHAVPLL